MTLEPASPPSTVLPAGWAAAPSLMGVLPTWAEATALLAAAGSPMWWERSSSSYPAQALLAALVRRPELVASLAAIPPGSRVLDLACGPGVTTRLLVETGAAEAVGVDISTDMLTLAEQGPPMPEVSFRNADVTARLPFPDESFDAAVLGDFYDSRAVPELARVLRPGGIVAVRLTELLPGCTYSEDAGLDARATAAYQTGLHDRFGADERSWYARLREDGFGNPGSVLVDRFGPFDGLTALWAIVRQSLWVSGLCAGRLEEADAARIRWSWDPDNPVALPRSPDAHIATVMTLCTAVVVDGHLRPGRGADSAER